MRVQREAGVEGCDGFARTNSSGAHLDVRGLLEPCNLGVDRLHGARHLGVDLLGDRLLRARDLLGDRLLHARDFRVDLLGDRLLETRHTLLELARRARNVRFEHCRHALDLLLQRHELAVEVGGRARNYADECEDDSNRNKLLDVL